MSKAKFGSKENHYLKLQVEPQSMLSKLGFDKNELVKSPIEYDENKQIG